jgi:hypothetical protein
MTTIPRWPVTIVISGLLMSNLVLADVEGPVRVVVTLWFLLVCTGMAFVPLLGIPSLSSELAVGVAVSLVLDTLVATAIVLVGGLSATSGLLVLEAICLVGCAAQTLAWARLRAVPA